MVAEEIEPKMTWPSIHSKVPLIRKGEKVMLYSTGSDWVPPVGSAMLGRGHGMKLCRHGPDLMENVVQKGRQVNKQALDLSSSFCILELLNASKGVQKTSKLSSGWI